MKKQKNKADKEEILILHAPHHLVNILLRMYVISFDALYDSLSAANKANENDVPDAHIVPQSGKETTTNVIVTMWMVQLQVYLFLTFSLLQRVKHFWCLTLLVWIFVETVYL